VASLCAQRLPLVPSMSCSTSFGVRCSRVRRSRLGGRLSVTVRFTVVGNYQDGSGEWASDIIVGKRGTGRLTGLLLGSVSQKLVSLSPLPVTVIP
jgi:nucleotide-binding universal stress UspA family protein